MAQATNPIASTARATAAATARGNPGHELIACSLEILFTEDRRDRAANSPRFRAGLPCFR
jgi:hypothetical protein